MAAARIYIGRIGSRVSERDIEHFFRGYGRIRDILLKNGFGFVEFDDRRDAEDAVYDLNGKELGGERVILDYSKPRGGGFGGRGGGRSGAYGGRGGRDYGGRGDDRGRRESRYGRPYSTRHRLVVENLSSRISWQDLKDQVRRHGIEPTYAEAHKRPNEALMCFSSSEDLKKCIDKCDGMELNGKKIKLIDDSQSGRSRSRSRSRDNKRRSRSRGSSKSSKSRSRSRSPRRRRESKSRSRSNSRSRSRSPARKSRSRSRSPAKKASPAHSRSASPKRDARSRSASPMDKDD